MAKEIDFMVVAAFEWGSPNQIDKKYKYPFVADVQ